MKNYNENERSCEATFFSAGPYWHAYTLGKETPILFTGSDDLRFAMNVIAQAADKFPELRIIAFEVMTKHSLSLSGNGFSDRYLESSTPS